MDSTPQTFTVPADISGFVKSLIFDNAPTANLWLHKVDAQTGLGLQGAVFTIKKGNGEIVKQNAETSQGGYLKVNDLDPGTKNIGCCAKAERPYFFAYFWVAAARVAGNVRLSRYNLSNGAAPGDRDTPSAAVETNKSGAEPGALMKGVVQ